MYPAAEVSIRTLSGMRYPSGFHGVGRERNGGVVFVSVRLGCNLELGEYMYGGVQASLEGCRLGRRVDAGGGM